MTLFFVRGGGVNPGGNLYYAGQTGYYWSSRATPTISLAYSLYFTASGVDPSYSLNRYSGYPLRCLIPTT